MATDTALGIPFVAKDAASDGTVFVEGLATDDDLDLDDQRIEKSFASRGLAKWFREWGSVRQMHSGNLAPAGRAVRMEERPEGIWVRVHVVEPTAVKLVKERVYQAFSVGISQPRIVHDRLAKGGLVVDGIFSEISLVDFPSNPRAKFQLAKRAGSAIVELQRLSGLPKAADRVESLQRDEIDHLVVRARSYNTELARLASDRLINLVGPYAAAELISGTPTPGGM